MLNQISINFVILVSVFLPRGSTHISFASIFSYLNLFQEPKGCVTSLIEQGCTSGSVVHVRYKTPMKKNTWNLLSRLWYVVVIYNATNQMSWHLVNGVVVALKKLDVTPEVSDAEFLSQVINFLLDSGSLCLNCLFKLLYINTLLFLRFPWCLDSSMRISFNCLVFVFIINL